MFASIEDFNQMPVEDVQKVIRVWAPIEGWADTINRRRPFSSIDELVAFADSSARRWCNGEVLAALDSHAQLGKKPTADDANSAHSRREQSSMGELSVEIQKRIKALQEEYQARFGHIFLIRAAGRSAEQILEALEVRLTRTGAEEAETTANELREIALLRLNQAFSESM